jgi:dihydrofolate reductase
MRKIVAAINMTVDGFCDHTAINPDEEIHYHYSELLRNAGIILYGRITYQLMEYWPPLVKNPSGNKSMDEFAIVIDQIQKIVFSNTLKDLEWKSAKLATKNFADEILDLKQEKGKDVLIGSRSLIVEALNLGLVDEFQLCVHPVIAGKGLPLFNSINDEIDLQLLRTKTFNSGAILFYYKPVKK